MATAKRLGTSAASAAEELWFLRILRLVVSGRDFVDPLGRDCFFYVAENIERGCESLHGRGDLANVFSWTNNEGETPWDECCWCGGGTLVYEPALIVKESSTPLP